jgi:putative transposase
MTQHKGWYSRGYLPHWDQAGVVQAVTFHLADSLPLRLLNPGLLPEDEQEAQRVRVQRTLDAGWGGCVLADPRAATIVEDSLLYGDGSRYLLLAWVVMLNHVHVLVELLERGSLPRIVQAWKGYSAKQINALLGRHGRLWHRDYFDRCIRDERHLENATLYLHWNPVKAGLVERPQDWRYGSARLVETLDSTWHIPYSGQDGQL